MASLLWTISKSLAEMNFQKDPWWLIETTIWKRQFINTSRLSMSNKLRKLLHINLLFQLSMKKNVLFISNGYKNQYLIVAITRNRHIGSLSYWRKNINIIRAIILSVALGKKKWFEMINLAINAILESKHNCNWQISLQMETEQIKHFAPKPASHQSWLTSI